MIRFHFIKPTIATRPGGGFYVTHANGIIATTDTRHEAESVAGLLAGVVMLVNESQGTHRWHVTCKDDKS